MTRYHFAKTLGRSALLLTFLCALPGWMYAKDSLTRLKRITQSLPDLAEPGSGQAGYFSLDDRELTVGYDTSLKKWSASAYYSPGESPVFNANYGLAFNKRLASGASFAYGKDYQEVFLSEVFSPQRDIRLRFAGGQLLQNNFQLTDYDEIGTVSQNSYLVELRKSWDRTSMLSGVGLSLFDVRANVRPRDVTVQDEADSASAWPGYSRGWMQGYAFNLRLEPSTRSRIELDLGAHRRTSFFGELSQRQQTDGSYRVHLTHYLNNCSRLQTEYSASSSEESVNVMMGKGAWRIGFSSALAATESTRDYAFSLSYAIPLDGWGSTRSSCGFGSQTAYAFSPMVDDAISRPALIPTQPLPLE
ncbi:hypothetical protein [Noviherbaspirillum massiliense]|uniref:hypothetical protein n=1 Tax=Noviherbaspirillum massiliense TaxID=1465823 RepID=UPI00031F3314|nr:hypothetical protein [Noviherbaspirillum massiliense]